MTHIPDLGPTKFPYPGLRPFKHEETDIFFGRGEQIDQLLNKLRENHFIAVAGLSGYGKSSLVNTGLLGNIKAGCLDSHKIRWRVARLQPGPQPLKSLGDALKLAFSSTDDFKDVQQFLGMLSNHTNLLLLVDQFEEFFRFASPDNQMERIAFVSELLQSSRLDNVYVVITIQSDYVGECSRFFGLTEAVNKGWFLIPRLTWEQVREAIIFPSQVFKGDVENELVSKLLEDMGYDVNQPSKMQDDPDQLPLLQHALMRMWDIAQRENPPIPPTLTLKHYEKVGGYRGALSQHAEQAYQELSPEQEKIAEILFRNLTARHFGETEHDEIIRRRPVKLEEVAQLANVPWEQVRDVVEVFRQDRRNFLVPRNEEELTAMSMLDISHESLIRQWSRLKNWAETEAKEIELYSRLERDAHRWKERATSSLWEEGDLENATSWHKRKGNTVEGWVKRYKQKERFDEKDRKRFDTAMEFLKASESAEQNRQKNTETALKRQENRKQRNQAGLQQQESVKKEWHKWLKKVVEASLGVVAVIVGAIIVAETLVDVKRIILFVCLVLILAFPLSEVWEQYDKGKGKFSRGFRQKIPPASNKQEQALKNK